MSKSNKDPPKKPDSEQGTTDKTFNAEERRPSSSATNDVERKKKEAKDKKRCQKSRFREKENRLLNELAEVIESFIGEDCKKKCKKKSKEKSSCKKCRECVGQKSKKAKKKRSSSEGACGGGSEDEGPDDGEELNPAMQVESSSEFEDPRPGCNRDPPARQECRRKRRLQRLPAERPNDSSSSSSCSPRQQRRKSRGRKPSRQRCAQNERNNATFIVQKSPVKEQCESQKNEADSACGGGGGGRPQIQRLRMQLIHKVRKKAPNVQEQVKRAIRMMKLDELEKFDRKTRGQSEFTKAQCNQFMRMYDEWQSSIQVKKFVGRSIKGPVADYWDRRKRQSEQAAAATTSLFDQAPRVVAPAADGGYSPTKESSGEWRTPPRQQVRTRRRGDLGARRKIEFSSESDSDGESRPRVRPRRRRPRSRDDDDDGSPQG